jgi:crotonobetainyl-CoA:carnitine CoA-transferase CaiB-like acyl-CoA transferase
MTFKPASTALSRFTVIDLTRVRSGPTCVRQLADWGADVIKVEIPEGPEDGSKGNTPEFSARHEPDFQNLHRNKRSISLNLKAPEAIEVLKRLVKRADVVVENYRPDVKGRLGIDYESLKAINPRLVYTSISGFGQDGPYRDRPGVDQIAQGMGGLMSVTGEPGRGPMRVGIPIADLTAGLFAAIGTLTALLEREASGQGQWVHTSLLEAQIFMLDFQAARWLMNKDVPGQVGNDHPTGVPTGRFKTSDGYINIAPTPAMWRRFCTTMGLEAIADQSDFATPAARRKNRARINEMIEKITVAKDSASWIARLNEAGIPCGPIYSIDQTFADEQVRHLGIAQNVASPAMGEITIVGQPVNLSRTPSSLAVAAPEHGEHTDEVLRWIGYSSAEIADLRRRKAV